MLALDWDTGMLFRVLTASPVTGLTLDDEHA